MRGTVGTGGESEDKLGFQVDFHRVLPPVVHFVVLYGPACIAVLLAAYGRNGSEDLGALALIDALVRIAVIALAWSVHKAGVNNAAFAGNDAAVFEQRAKALAEDGVTRLENACGFGCDGLLVFNGVEQSATSLCLAIALHRLFDGSRLGTVKALLRGMRFPEVPESHQKFSG
jgi:hypothetical protein